MSQQDPFQPEQPPLRTSPVVPPANPPVADGNAPVSQGPGLVPPLASSPPPNPSVKPVAEPVPVSGNLETPLKAEPAVPHSGAEGKPTSPEQAMIEAGLPPLEDDSPISQEGATASKTVIVDQVAPTQASEEKHLAIHWLDLSGLEISVNETGSPVIIGRAAGQGNESSTAENLEKAGLYYLGVPEVVDIKKISRVHAQVEYQEGGALRLKDLNSYWGVYVNEAKINKEKEITQEDQIALTDDISFQVKIVDGPFTNPPKVLTPATSVSERQPDSEAQADTLSSKPEEHLVIDGGLDWDRVLQNCERFISPPEEWDPTELLNRTEALLEKEGPMGLAFEQHRNDLKHQAFKVPELPPDEVDLWFIGDIHGDLLGMESSLAYIHHQAKVAGKTPWVVFLGDFIDRGPHNHQVMLRLFEYIDANKATTCAIVGNHDVGFGFNEANGQFTSTMQPCEYPDWLNENLKDELAVQTGKLTVQFFDKIPKAFFLPDGLIVAHGCVPHKDITAEFKGEKDLNTELALKDFVNARIHAKMPRKRPNRSSSTHQLGREDFELFCAKATEILGQPVIRMIKGHEHIPERYSTYEKFIDHPMLVINNMCTSQGDFVMGDNPPCVARWRVGKPPEVHPVKIPRYLIEKIYDLSGATGESEDTIDED